jgi:hypothetical protein
MIPTGDGSIGGGGSSMIPTGGGSIGGGSSMIPTGGGSLGGGSMIPTGGGSLPPVSFTAIPDTMPPVGTPPPIPPVFNVSFSFRFW